jgi:copper chaperone
MVNGEQENQKTIIMHIQGMSCEHCQMTINKGLKALPGIKEIDIDLASGRAEVCFDPTLTGVDLIKQKIRDLGYQVK